MSQYRITLHHVGGRKPWRYMISCPCPRAVVVEGRDPVRYDADGQHWMQYKTGKRRRTQDEAWLDAEDQVRRYRKRDAAEVEARKGLDAELRDGWVR